MRCGAHFPFDPKINGYNIQLTIDIDLQRIIQEELIKITKKTSAKGANGIIMDPYTGEIIAMASIPDFNPNTYFEYFADKHLIYLAQRFCPFF